MGSLANAMSPAARKLVIAKLRPKLEPHLKTQDLLWEDVLPALDSIDSVFELRAAIENPQQFLESLANAMSPAARKLMIAKLRPKLEPHLETQGLLWEDVLPAHPAENQLALRSSCEVST